LKGLGIAPTEIKWIVISHFHGDHIAGLKDFPQAKFLCTESALAEVYKYKGLRAVKRGILHGLIPNDFAQRVHTFEGVAAKQFTDQYGLKRYEWEITPGISWVFLPGHARGMIGFEFVQENRTILYATDAAWSHAAFRDHVLPMPIVKVFIDSMSAMENTWHCLHAWQKDHPNGEIYFTHCPKTSEILSHE
jgi:glyoxylase-like metal-dependent hydrolase (beta-lactamase superfamily II)